jgi:hypothetical protein
VNEQQIWLNKRSNGESPARPGIMFLEACLLRGATPAVCCLRFDSGSGRFENTLRPWACVFDDALPPNVFCSMRLQRLYCSSLQGRGVRAMIVSHPMLIL